MYYYIMNNQRQRKKRIEENTRNERHEEKTIAKTQLGCIRWGKHFLLDGIVYKVLRYGGENYIVCLNIETKEEKKFRDDIKVEEIGN